MAWLRRSPPAPAPSAEVQSITLDKFFAGRRAYKIGMLTELYFELENARGGVSDIENYIRILSRELDFDDPRSAVDTALRLFEQRNREP